MLYILSGRDDFSLEQALASIKASIGDPETLATNAVTLDGTLLTVNQLTEVCQAAPFLGGKRLVIVRGLLGRFQSADRPRRQGRSRKTPSQREDHTPLAACIQAAPESTVLVLVEEEIRDDNPLYRQLAGKAEVRTFPLLKDSQLKQWVQGRVQDAGGSISPGAVDLLARLVGSNLWVMSNEIDKLLLYASGRRINEDDVTLLVGHSQQSSIFAMVDAIVEFRAQAAERRLQELLQRGASPGYLLAMLTRQVRLMVRARDVGTRRMTAAELRSKLGLSSEFVARKTLEQARRYSLPRLKQVYQQLLEADLAIKTSRYEPELALSILAAELCQRPRVQAGNASQ